MRKTTYSHPVFRLRIEEASNYLESIGEKPIPGVEKLNNESQKNPSNNKEIREALIAYESALVPIRADLFKHTWAGLLLALTLASLKFAAQPADGKSLDEAILYGGFLAFGLTILYRRIWSRRIERPIGVQAIVDTIIEKRKNK